MSWCKKLHERQLGIKDRMNNDYRNLYGRMACREDSYPQDDNRTHKGIFNLNFSDDGRMLVAATENKSILVLDPLTQKKINQVTGAHNDCVNFIRFLDNRLIASCSDDMSIKLWDVRNLSTSIQRLQGHEGWVKNIEYSKKEGLLVTSGFDGNIHTWDINRVMRLESEYCFNRIIHTNGLMRMRLSPDETKMIVCTTQGFLMLIHDLNLHTFADDLRRFQPDLYRLHQRGSMGFSTANHDEMDHVFEAPRNRIELISDFPDGNSAEVISTLQVHPKGWCVLSRNRSHDEDSEWMCVHDILELDRSEARDVDSDEEILTNPLVNNRNGRSSRQLPMGTRRTRSPSNAESTMEPARRRPRRADTPIDDEFEDDDVNYDFGRLRFRIDNWRRRNTFRWEVIPRSGRSTERSESLQAQRSASTSNDSASLGAAAGGTEGSERRADGSSSSESDTSNDGVRVFEVSTEGRSSPHVHVRSHGYSLPILFAPVQRSSAPFVFYLGSNESIEQQAVSIVNRITAQGPSPFQVVQPLSPTSASPYYSPGSPSFSNAPSSSNVDKKSKPRLLFYQRESNVGRGFIKELCFNTDGKVICSPFNKGIRLFAFDDRCSELSECIPRRPKLLKEIASYSSHENFVVSTKFSPTHTLLASGCLSGRICFHYPKL